MPTKKVTTRVRVKDSCKYCGEQIAKCGMDAHVHFRHRGSVLAEFRVNPLVQLFTYGKIVGFTQLALPPARGE